MKQTNICCYLNDNNENKSDCTRKAMTIDLSNENKIDCKRKATTIHLSKKMQAKWNKEQKSEAGVVEKRKSVPSSDLSDNNKQKS